MERNGYARWLTKTGVAIAAQICLAQGTTSLTEVRAEMDEAGLLERDGEHVSDDVWLIQVWQVGPFERRNGDGERFRLIASGRFRDGDFPIPPPYRDVIPELITTPIVLDKTSPTKRRSKRCIQKRSTPLRASFKQS